LNVEQQGNILVDEIVLVEIELLLEMIGMNIDILLQIGHIVQIHLYENVSGAVMSDILHEQIIGV
jgi:hypothetical protein